MVAETLSSHAQTTFIPPAHFLKVIVQRGTIIMFIPAPVVAGVPIIAPEFDMGIPGMFIPARSIMIADVIPISLLWQSCPLAKRASESSTAYSDNLDDEFQVVLH